MVLKVFNTLGREKQEFIPIDPNNVRMYSCGPTVNGPPHLGHAKSMISFDIIRRYLVFSGYKLKFVSNITDIDDKIIKKAEEEKISTKELSKKYEKEHLEAYKKLNIPRPDILPHATEYIKEMIEIIKLLEQKGYTYKTTDGIYYDIAKFKEYGKLSGQKLSELKESGRIKTNKEKKNPGDFVLWKFAKPNEPKWSSPWGEGRPGWHIECSAMTWKLLGVPFDIHAGGSDLIFPHHEDEIAQTEAALEKPMAKYWIHTGMVNINKTKMSKSLGNLKTLAELFEKYNPMVIRYLVISTHYRKPLEFSDSAMEEAKNSYERLKRIALNSTGEGVNKEYLDKFKKSMDDDFNTPKAMAVLWELLRDKKVKEKMGTLKEIEKVFALNILEKEEQEIPEEIKKLADERMKARREKNWEKSDKIREIIKKKGWMINDAKDSYTLEKLKT